MMSEAAILASQHTTAELSFHGGLVKIYHPMPSELGNDWAVFALGKFADSFPNREAALIWAMEQALEYLTSIPNWDQQP